MQIIPLISHSKTKQLINIKTRVPWGNAMQNTKHLARLNETSLLKVNDMPSLKIEIFHGCKWNWPQPIIITTTSGNLPIYYAPSKNPQNPAAFST